MSGESEAERRFRYLLCFLSNELVMARQMLMWVNDIVKVNSFSFEGVTTTWFLC